MPHAAASYLFSFFSFSHPNRNDSIEIDGWTTRRWWDRVVGQRHSGNWNNFYSKLIMTTFNLFSCNHVMSSLMPTTPSSSSSSEPFDWLASQWMSFANIYLFVWIWYIRSIHDRQRQQPKILYQHHHHRRRNHFKTKFGYVIRVVFGSVRARACDQNSKCPNVQIQSQMLNFGRNLLFLFGIEFYNPRPRFVAFAGLSWCGHVFSTLHTSHPLSLSLLSI